MEKDTAMPDRTVLQEPTTGDCDQVWAWRKWLWKKRREQGTAFQEREGQRRACGERKRRNETPGRGWGQKGRRSRTNPSPPPHCLEEPREASKANPSTLAAWYYAYQCCCGGFPPVCQDAGIYAGCVKSNPDFHPLVPMLDAPRKGEKQDMCPSTPSRAASKL